LWKALEEVFPSTRRQRCWVHKTVNVLNKVASSVQVNMKADLREIYGAPTRAEAEAGIDTFAEKYGVKYDKAVACLTKDREALAMLDGGGQAEADLAAPLFVLTNTAVPFLAEVIVDLDPLWVAAAMSVLAGALAGKGLAAEAGGRN
jgi:hypothetical protein